MISKGCVNLFPKLPETTGFDGIISSVARSGGIPPKWLNLAAPWRENFDLADSAKCPKSGYFWVFQLLFSKITK